MNDYFLREYKLLIDDLEITELRIKFEVDKSLVGSPNLAKIDIYNLKESDRNKINNEYSKVELYAGYKNKAKLIFKGEVRNIVHNYVAVDYISTIFAADGALALETATIDETFPAGTSTEDMVTKLLTKLPGISKGSMEGIKKCLTNKRSLLKSLLMSGSVKEWIDKLSADCGFNYSVNDGVVDVNTKGKPLNDEPTFLVSQKTGMIGTPEVTEIGANCTVYLRGELKLARRFKIESPTATINVGNQFFRKVNKNVNNNTYMIQQIKHTGDTHANEWKTDLIGVISNA